MRRERAMRRAFTLIEMLVVTAIIGVVCAAAVVSTSGRDASRLKGAARDVFVTMRQARAIALVTQQPCVVTYANSTSNGEPCVRVTTDSVSLISSSSGVAQAQTLSGETVNLDGSPCPPAGGDGLASAHMAAGRSEEPVADADSGGETMEEILFAPVDDEVMTGLAIKVVTDGDAEAEASGVSQAAREASLSAFSNTDFLLGRFREAKKVAADKAAAEAAKAAEEAGEAASAPAAPDSSTWTVKWSPDGRCEPHRVYVYLEGTEWEKGYCITVDRFGTAKATYAEEAER